MKRLVKPQERKSNDTVKAILDVGYSRYIRDGYVGGYWEVDGGKFSLGNQSLSLPKMYIENLISDRKSAHEKNGKPKMRIPAPIGKKIPEKETINGGKGGKLFDLEAVLLEMEIGEIDAKHPYIRETIQRNGYDEFKAAKEMNDYFENEVWMKILPFIYVKNGDLPKPLNRLGEGNGTRGVAVDNLLSDAGYSMHPAVAGLLHSDECHSDKKALVWELKPFLKGLNIDWEKAESVMEHLNVFGVSAFFAHGRMQRNSVRQAILRNDLEDALAEIRKFDTKSDRAVACCWLIMGCLNNGMLKEAKAVLSGLKPDESGWVTYINAVGLIGMYYGRMGMEQEAAAHYRKAEELLVEKRTDGWGWGLRSNMESLILWKKRAGFEALAIQTALEYFRDRQQEAIFQKLDAVRPFEMPLEEFEIR